MDRYNYLGDMRLSGACTYKYTGLLQDAQENEVLQETEVVQEGQRVK